MKSIERTIPNDVYNIWKLKDRYEEELLFFRLGDFYELFFEDGETAARELELTLTGKNAGLKTRVPMCGVPHHSAKSTRDLVWDIR